MIKKVIVFFIMLLLVYIKPIEAVDINARHNLVEKYSESKELYITLKAILKPSIESRKEVNDLYNALSELKKSKELKSSNILVDLLDFYIGEAPNEIINQAIVEKGIFTLSLLKKKLNEPIIKGELPNELNDNVILKKRNERIVLLIEHIYYGVPYAIEYNKLNREQLTMVKLFHIQKDIERYYSKTGEFPLNLKEIQNESFNNDLNYVVDAWGRPFRYKAVTGFYFLGSKGDDGIDGTADDIIPPICKALHEFPKK